MKLKLFLPVLLALVTLVGLPSHGNAALIVQSVVSSASSFSAVVDWEAGGPAAEVENLSDSSWTVLLVGSDPANIFLVTAQHVTEADPADSPAGASLVLLTNISPGGAAPTQSENGIHAPHFDRLRVTATSLNATTTRFNIEAAHVVPEPGTLALGLLGGGLVLLVRRRATRA